MPNRPADPTEIARLSSALDRAALRARMATAAGRWEEAAEASAEAGRLSAQLQASRRPPTETNIVRRVKNARG